MIIDLPTTNSSKINKALVDLREKGGSIALGRVLTLVIVTEEAAAEDPIAAANAASFEHPCRVIVVARGSKRASARMDAQIRVGGDAGASEVIVLRLYGALVDHGASVVVPLLLADAPVVVWWPGEAPEVPAEDPIGDAGERRITDASSANGRSRNSPSAAIPTARRHRPGVDQDDPLAGPAGLHAGPAAARQDHRGHGGRCRRFAVGGPAGRLARFAVEGPGQADQVADQVRARPALGEVEPALRGHQPDPPADHHRRTKVANQPERHVALPRRGLRDCLSEELRRLDADDIYSDVLSKGMALVAKHGGRDEGRTGEGSGGEGCGAKAAGQECGAKPPVRRPSRSADRSRGPAQCDRRHPRLGAAKAGGHGQGADCQRDQAPLPRRPRPREAGDAVACPAPRPPSPPSTNRRSNGGDRRLKPFASRTAARRPRTAGAS